MLTDFNFDGPIVQWLNDYAPQGILITDADLIIRGWNRWLEQHTGRTSQSVVGQPLFDIFPELVERHFDRFYEKALDGQITVLAHRFHQYLVKLPTKPEFGVPEMKQSARIAPLVSGGEIVGTVTSIEDVTERAIREDQLVAATEAAEKANQAKDHFLAVLAHDLRTPMTAILGWARLVRDHPKQQRIVTQGAEVIERNVEVQLQLIEQVLDISRISTAKLELNIEAANVREITLATIESMEPLAEAQCIAVHRELPDEPRTAELDPKRLQQIIWNLFSNALKFTPTGGWVRVALAYCHDGFQLTIADSGKGISEESLSRLFEPLFQAEGSKGHGGLGLGLAIVKNLVELHGGSIRAASPGIGMGAEFVVKMPWSGPRVQECGSAASQR